MSNAIIEVKGVHCYLDDNGTAWLNAGDVARGLGWVQTQVKNGKEYTSIRWERMNKYLKEFSFPQEVGEEDFVPENMFYRLVWKSQSENALKFQALVADEILPQIRKTGVYVSKDQMLTPEFLHELADRLEYYQRRLEEEKARVDDMQVTHDLYKRTTFRVGFPFTMKIVADVVKEIGLGRNKLYEFLREQKILTEKNEPMRQYQECGYFQSCFVEYFDQYIVYVSLSGLKFIFKKLVQAGKISSKIGLDTYIEMSVNEIRAYNEEQGVF